MIVAIYIFYLSHHVPHRQRETPHQKEGILMHDTTNSFKLDALEISKASKLVLGADTVG